MSEPIIYGVGWAAVNVSEQHAAKWNIYEVFGVGVADDKPSFTKWNSSGSPEPVNTVEETEPWGVLTVKRDGCSHFHFRDDDGMFHICGYDAWLRFHEVITDLFLRSIDVLEATGPKVDPGGFRGLV